MDSECFRDEKNVMTSFLPVDWNTGKEVYLYKQHFKKKKKNDETFWFSFFVFFFSISVYCFCFSLKVFLEQFVSWVKKREMGLIILRLFRYANGHINDYYHWSVLIRLAVAVSFLQLTVDFQDFFRLSAQEKTVTRVRLDINRREEKYVVVLRKIVKFVKK